MRSTLKKLAVITAVTATSLIGLSNTSAAHASAIQPPVEVAIATAFPLCYGIGDTLGNRVDVCLTSVKATPATAPEVGYFVTALGSARACYLGRCTAWVDFALHSTGASVEPATLVPTITPGPATVVPLSRVCVGSICTPGSVTVPSYTISLLPPGSTPVRVCANGVCAEPSTAKAIEFDTGDALQAIAISAN